MVPGFNQRTVGQPMELKIQNELVRPKCEATAKPLFTM